MISSVGMMKFPIYGKTFFFVPNHQPVVYLPTKQSEVGVLINLKDTWSIWENDLRVI
jgi:hypothetical protein